jgi:peptidoglycan/xylan/chitin deacetylase (PgdA/CDA1 family)
MAKYAIIRDDDANFFTSPKMLQSIYEEIFALDASVNYSVIPCVETGLKLRNRSFHGIEIQYEPFIPEEYHDIHRSFAVYENHELVEFIKNSEDHIDLFQHGFSHRLYEFSSTNFGELHRRILIGRKVLQKAFDRVPTFFCAPYDMYSPISLFLVKKYFRGATYGEMTLKSIFSPRYGVRLPLNMVPSFVNASKNGSVFSFHDNFLLLGYDHRTRINPFENSASAQQAFTNYAESHEVIVIALHYWEFFYDKAKKTLGETVNKNALENILQMIQWLKDKGTKFLTATQFYEKLS